MSLLETLAARAAALARTGLAAPVPEAHRALQQQAEACTYASLAGETDAALLGRAAACLDALAAQQGEQGLFLTGDNVESPPDSSFTANGLARLVRVCRGREHVQPLADQALDILWSLRPGLVSGGVHTPNHRWEIAAALAQLADLIGDEECGARADEWLAEGVDLQPDGLFSERSPNYAAHVTNPCLLVLADLRGRPELVDAVHDNLHAHLLLTDRTGRVETLQSRRQDQKSDGFPMSQLAWLYRVVAHRTGCGRCGAAAVDGESRGGSDVLDAIAGALLDPRLADEPPVRPEPPRTGWTVLEPSGLAIHRSDRARLVVREAPDVATLGRVASGTAANPTLAHFRAGGVWLSSVRLSRAFFGLGPFRGQSLALDGGRAVLEETQAAAYYQPMTGDGLRFEFEGRFAAEMGFSSRSGDLVTLGTTVTVAPRRDGFELSVETDGPQVSHALELGFAEADAASVDGEAKEVGDGRWLVVGDTEVRVGGAVVSVTPTGHDGSASPLRAFYDPGEAYTFLGGTDAVGGLRLYVPAWSPGGFGVAVRIEGERE